MSNVTEKLEKNFLKIKKVNIGVTANTKNLFPRSEKRKLSTYKTIKYI